MWSALWSSKSCSSAPPPPRLSEDEAFALATHWREQLHDVVRLETHDEHTHEPVAFVDATCSVVAHFEWVTFQGPVSTPGFLAREEPWVRAASASMLVWLALASCPGFSSRENPRFWKRVFSALWVGGHGRQIADDVCFFEHPDRPFPSVRIDSSNGLSSKTLRVIYNGMSHDQELKKVLHRIEPYVDQPEWWNREIPVEIVGFAFMSESSKIRRKWYVPKRRRPSYQKPAFRLVAVRMLMRRSSLEVGAPFSEMGDYTLSTAAFRSLSSLFEGVPVHATYCRLEASPEPSVFLAEQQPSSRCFNVDTISLRTSILGGNNQSAYVAMCSALPHSRLITALELDHRDLELSKGDGAWLGYALFHPDTATRSSLSALTLRLPGGTSTFADQLSHMATGNNLLLVMGVTSIPSSAYYETRLARRTCVYEDGFKDSPVIYKFPSEQTVTLCITSAEDVKRHEWVRIVVPGLSLGWVQAKHIGSVVARAPGRSSLRRLRLFGYPFDYPAHAFSSQNTRVLLLIGTSLTHLKIMFSLNNDDLRQVLQCCRHLRALRVCHNGAIWSHASPTGMAATLETLELVISGHLYPLVAPELCDMTCLRVVDNGSTDWRSTPNRDTLLAMLHKHKQLTYVYWSNLQHKPWWETHRYRPWWMPTAISDLRDWQSTSYGILGQGVRGVLDRIRSPLPLESRIGFLSVFSHITKGRSSAIPVLTSDVVRLVFAFSEIHTPRQLLIRCSLDDPTD